MSTKPTDSTPAEPESADDRDKFLAALEAKKHRSGHGSHTQDSGAAAKGHTSKTGGKREFRRKSGG